MFFSALLSRNVVSRDLDPPKETGAKVPVATNAGYSRFMSTASTIFSSTAIAETGRPNGGRAPDIR
jgi:hypothetical protein